MADYTLSYCTGAATVEKNSDHVIGINSFWSDASINPGDLITFDNYESFKEIRSVNSDTSITLRTPWDKDSITGHSYNIVRNFTATSTSKIAAQVSTILTEIHKTYDENLSQIRGKSAYDIAIDNGFSGSESDFIESLKASGDIAMLREYDADLNRRINSLSQDIDSHSATLATHDENISSQAGRIGNLEVDNTAEKTDISGLKSSSTSHTSQLNDHADRISTLESDSGTHNSQIQAIDSRTSFLNYTPYVRNGNNHTLNYEKPLLNNSVHRGKYLGDLKEWIEANISKIRAGNFDDMFVGDKLTGHRTWVYSGTEAECTDIWRIAHFNYWFFQPSLGGVNQTICFKPHVTLVTVLGYTREFPITHTSSLYGNWENKSPTGNYQYSMTYGEYPMDYMHCALRQEHIYGNDGDKYAFLPQYKEYFGEDNFNDWVKYIPEQIVSGISSTDKLSYEWVPAYCEAVTEMQYYGHRVLSVQTEAENPNMQFALFTHTRNYGGSHMYFRDYAGNGKYAGRNWSNAIATVEGANATWVGGSYVYITIG